MDDHCWLCGYKLKPECFEDIVYTKGGPAHSFCVEIYTEEVVEDER